MEIYIIIDKLQLRSEIGISGTHREIIAFVQVIAPDNLDGVSAAESGSSRYLGGVEHRAQLEVVRSNSIWNSKSGRHFYLEKKNEGRHLIIRCIVVFRVSDRITLLGEGWAHGDYSITKKEKGRRRGEGFFSMDKMSPHFFYTSP